MGVSPNDSLWAMLTIALAPLITLTRSGELSLGANQTSTPIDSAWDLSISIDSSSPPPTCARESPDPDSMEIVSQVPLTNDALPTVTT